MCMAREAWVKEGEEGWVFEMWAIVVGICAWEQCTDKRKTLK